jgi:hypothetical protein
MIKYRTYSRHVAIIFGLVLDSIARYVPFAWEIIPKNIHNNIKHVILLIVLQVGKLSFRSNKLLSVTYICTTLLYLSL